MLNPLLIQLFGRDVVDRLEHAGLQSDEAVAQLAADELSRRVGITPDVAGRVIALVVELCAEQRPGEARGAAARTRSARGGARPKRQPRPQRAPADPVVPSERAAAPSGPADSDTDEESLEMLALQEDTQEIDAFVDEAGLIAWMGFASRTGAESSLLSGVAEGILNPASPHDQDPPQSATAAASHAATASRPTSAVTAGAAVVTLEGSFWEFGSRPHPGVTVSPVPAREQRPQTDDDESEVARSRPVLPVPFHRRRSHDGH